MIEDRKYHLPFSIIYRQNITMSDSGGNQFGSEVIETVREVANDVKDAAGEALEQGFKSTVGPTLTPQQIQQQQQKDQEELAGARWKIEQLKKIDQEQEKIRQQNLQKEAQRIQAQQQEKQEKVQQVQIQTAKKQQIVSEEVLRSRAELKIGKGVGG